MIRNPRIPALADGRKAYLITRILAIGGVNGLGSGQASVSICEQQS